MSSPFHLPKELQQYYPKKLYVWDVHQKNLSHHLAELLLTEGKAIVTPTKVGYIVMTIDRVGLEKKFTMKGRPKTKPGVVLCSNLEQLETLAETNAKIRALYKSCWDNDILIGCILPWKQQSVKNHIPEHHGEIWVTSEGEGRGSHFFVSLPLFKEAEK